MDSAVRNTKELWQWHVFLYLRIANFELHNNHDVKN